MNKILLLLWGIFTVTQSQAATWYVSPTGAGSGNGTSCSNAAAASSLQTIINNAAANDAINLTAGTFSISAAITINKALTINGAGMGNTIITTSSGTVSLSPFTITANNVTISNLTLSAFPGSVSGAKGVAVDGKTGISLTNLEFKNMPSGQNSEVVNINNTNGACGVTVSGCWWHNNSNTNCLTITRAAAANAINITVENSVLASTTNSRGFPAGIYYNMSNGGSGGAVNLTINNCLFSCLEGTRGAAIGLYGGNGSIRPNIDIINSTFNGNVNTSTLESGGAIYVYRAMDASISGCIFDGNSTSGKGGAIYSDGATPQNVLLAFSSCIFRNNTSSTGGGAIHLEDVSNSAIANPSISNCLFHNNTGVGAGAIDTETGGTTWPGVDISGSTFTLNNGNNNYEAIHQNNSSGTMTINNCVIWDNPSSGGTNDELRVSAGTGLISGSVFNVVNSSGFGGGANNMYYENTTSGTITDNSCAGTPITRTFTVTHGGTVSNLCLGFNASHTSRGHIRVTLTSPSSTSVIVLNAVSDSDDNYDLLLTSASSNAIDDALLDDTASPYYDRWAAPSNAMTTFNGQAADGTWTATICDNTASTTGTFNRSALEFMVSPAINGSTYISATFPSRGYQGGVSGSFVGDYSVTDEQGCASRGFNFPTPTPYCITPTTESGSAPASGGVALANVASNDMVNGASAVLGTNASVSQEGSWPSGISLNTSTGAVNVANGTTVGTYNIQYRLCDMGSPVSCQTVSISVEVSAALPVEMISFRAVPRTGTVELNWETATEINNAGFELQRSSDSRQWKALCFIEGSGTSEGVHSYAYIDLQPIKGVNYYRLLQMDDSGQSEFSNIVSAHFRGEQGSGHVAPNPAQGEINCSFDLQEPGRTELVICDLLGKTVYSSTHELGQGYHSLPVNIDNLDIGIYFLKMKNNGSETAVIRFIKQ